MRMMLMAELQQVVCDRAAFMLVCSMALSEFNPELKLDTVWATLCRAANLGHSRYFWCMRYLTVYNSYQTMVNANARPVNQVIKI